MEYNVVHAGSWDEFEVTWIAIMETQGWYNNPKITDYDPKVEREELRDDFENDDHIYLIAKDGNGVGVGILEFRCYQNHANNDARREG
jgi:hypothetical protein